MKTTYKKVIVSLDGITPAEALKIAKILKGLVWGFKINDLLYHDASLIKKLKKFGGVFADAKLHDIPNTVGNSVKRLSETGADIITVHASGGSEMMRAAKENAGKSKIIGVTVLTSQKPDDVRVVQLVKDAVKSNLDGIVCSGHEIEKVRKIKGMNSKLIIVPGIRPKSYKTHDDQVRTVTPKQAFELGADYLVIGRPLTQSKNILQALNDLW
jgi:orotidine-5'-phosphate decarboxylase